MGEKSQKPVEKALWTKMDAMSPSAILNRDSTSVDPTRVDLGNMIHGLTHRFGKALDTFGSPLKKGEAKWDRMDELANLAEKFTSKIAEWVECLKRLNAVSAASGQATDAATVNRKRAKLLAAFQKDYNCPLLNDDESFREGSTYRQFD